MIRFTLIFLLIAIVKAEVKIDNEFKSNSLPNVKPLKVYKEPEVCLTAECYKAALEIRQNMNQSVNPCENFYEYACGGYAAFNPVPSRELTWGNFQKMRSKVRLQLLNLITEPIEPTDNMAVKKAKLYYQSCMDEVKVGYRGWRPIKAFLTQSGGWPLVMEPEEWNINKNSWQKINQFYTRLMFVSPFYRIRVIRDPREPNSLNMSQDDKKVIQILPAVVPLHRMAVYTGKVFNKLVKNMYYDGSYANYILRIARMFANGRSAKIIDDDIAEDVKNIIQLEKKFLSIYDNVYEVPQYATIDELQKIYNNASNTQDKPNIDWKKLVTEHFAEADVQLDGNEVFEIWNIKHFEVLSDILAKTDPRVIVNYMQWMIVLRLLSHTSFGVQTWRNELLQNKEGITKPRKRWQDCLRSVSMPHALAYMYSKKYFNDDDAPEEDKKLFSNAQKELVKHILEADWLTEETKNVAVEKITKMKAFISSSAVYNNETLLTNLYRGVVFGVEYMENFVAIRHFNGKRSLQLLKKPFSDKEFYAYPLILNVFYREQKGISVAELQFTIFSLLQPKNYGELSLLIGHEVYDGYGIEYDHDGQKYSWSVGTNKTLEERFQCFADQYKNFYANDKSKQIESEQKILLSENVGDASGLDIAFEAFQQIEKERQALRLPGFSLWSNEKIFFLFFAKTWCSSTRPYLEEKSRKITSDYRVNGPLQNSKHFAKVFNCPEDSPMNPNLKCKLW